MHDCIISQHHLPVHPEVPLSARRMAEEVARENARRDALARASLQQEVRETSQRLRQTMRGLIGDDKYAAFRHFLWTQRLDARNQLQPPEGLALDARVIARHRKDRASAFLQQLGVATDRLSEFVKEGRRTLNEVLERYPPHGELANVYTPAKYLHLFGEFMHALARPVTVFRPPYAGWQSGWSLDGGGDFRGGRTDFIDTLAGIVGHEVTLDNDDAGDFDFGVSSADAQLVFWFRPPATGILEVELEVQNLQGKHHLCTEDEWGWSDSNTKQYNYLMMHVLHPNVAGPSFAIASFFDWSTDDSECVDRQLLPSGAHFFTRLKSSGAVPAGQWVAIRAGTSSMSRSFTNDVEIHSSTRFQYLLRSVTVGVAP